MEVNQPIYKKNLIKSIYEYLEPEELLKQKSIKHSIFASALLQMKSLIPINFERVSLIKFGIMVRQAVYLEGYKNGEYLACGDESGIIHIVNFVRNRIEFTLFKHENSVWTLLYFPDILCLISMSLDKSFKIWDLTTQTCLNTEMMKEDWIIQAIKCPSYKPYGFIGTSTSGKIIISEYLPDSKKIQEINTITTDRKGILSVDFSSTKNQIAHNAKDKVIELINIADVNSKEEILFPEKISSFAFTTIGTKEYLIVTLTNKIISLVSLEDKRFDSSEPLEDNVHSILTTTVLGRDIAVFSTDFCVNFWDISLKQIESCCFTNSKTSSLLSIKHKGTSWIFVVGHNDSIDIYKLV